MVYLLVPLFVAHLLHDAAFDYLRFNISFYDLRLCPTHAMGQSGLCLTFSGWIATHRIALDIRLWMVSFIIALMSTHGTEKLVNRTPYDPTIVRCSTIQVGWNDRSTASPHSQGPYVINALYGGSVPFQIASVNGLNYNWTVQLPTGGPYILNMKDSQGYTGGVCFDSTTCGDSMLTLF